jgi:hypothetical protein
MPGRITRLALVVSALATALSMLAAPISAHAARDRCGVKGSKTIQANSSDRVYSVRARRHRTLYYGCLKKNGRRTRLATVEPGGCNGPDGIYNNVTRPPAKLQGPYVALVLEQDGCGDESFQDILRADLRGGRPTTVSGQVLSTTQQGSVQNIGVADFVLAGSGAVAWIGTSEIATQVAALGPSARAAKLLDSADASQGASQITGLRIENGQVLWTKGGVPSSAPVP